MGTFHDLPDHLVTPTRTFTASDLDQVVGLGSYTHPLFADAAFAEASSFGGRLFPGPAVVMFMAGMVEQTDRFDETVVALVGMDEIRFAGPVRPGDEVEVAIDVLEREVRSQGRRGVLHMRWTCRGARVASGDDDRVTLVARMLFGLEP